MILIEFGQAYECMNWVNDNEIIFSQPATIEELTLFHDLDYLKALEKAEKKKSLSELEKDTFKIGVGTNPIFDEESFQGPAMTKSSMTAIKYFS